MKAHTRDDTEKIWRKISSKQKQQIKKQKVKVIK